MPRAAPGRLAALRPARSWPATRLRTAPHGDRTQEPRVDLEVGRIIAGCPHSPRRPSPPGDSTGESRDTVTPLQELVAAREVLLALVWREVKARYRGSFLGFLWTLLNPLMFMAIYSLVFTVYLRIEMASYPVFLFTGLLPWIWFSSALDERRHLGDRRQQPGQARGLFAADPPDRCRHRQPRQLRARAAAAGGLHDRLPRSPDLGRPQPAGGGGHPVRVHPCPGRDPGHGDGAVPRSAAPAGAISSACGSS